MPTLAAQGPFPRRQAALAAQAQRADARGAVGALHRSAMPRSRPSVSYLSMIESGKRTPSSAAARACWRRCSSATPAWFLDESAELELPSPAGARRRRGAHPARAGVPVLQERAAGGDPGAAGADRHQRAAVRAPADPLAPGDVAQRLSRPRARRRHVGERRFPLSVEDLMRLCTPPRARDPLVRAQAGAGARQGPRGAQHGALVLRGAARGVRQPRAAVRPGAAEVRPGRAHRATRCCTAATA